MEEGAGAICVSGQIHRRLESASETYWDELLQQVLGT